MKKYQKFMAALAVLLVLPHNCILISASETGMLPEEASTVSDSALPADEATVSGNTPSAGETTVSKNTVPSGEAAVSGDSLSAGSISNETLLPVPASLEEPAPLPAQAPAFTARIQLLERYAVKGTFTEFRDDIRRIQTLYSLDGINYQECGWEWDLWFLGTKDPDELASLQTQVCLYDRFEPLKSYVAGTIDRFYLRLGITLRNGSTYESKAAVIDRGEPESVPEGISLTAGFAPSVSVIERNPLYCYGRYQLTVSPAATPEDIAALLPDTLPVNVSLYQGRGKIADCTVDCPVRWKPLSLPRLTAGESVTITDAAEDIIIPCGTLLRTPIGIFRLEDALPLMQDIVTSDEVRLVLNVTPKDATPTGVLSQETDGLEMAFDLKPTGATAIHAYTFSEQRQKWTKLPDLALPDAVNAYPSAANSGYTLVLRNDQEPYRSYLEAQAAGDTPAPFIVGLKIEGGTYHGRQMVLPWPKDYELPPRLPEVGGAGGNEGNAGSDNKDDSTLEGQRPNLPQAPETDSADSTQTPPEEHSAQTNSAPAQKEQQKLLLPDLSRTNKGQGALSDDWENSNNVIITDSDRYTAPSQVSVTAADEYEEDNADTYSADSTPTYAYANTASAAMLPAESSLSAVQEESSPAGMRRLGRLLIVTAVSAAALCIVYVTAGVHMKKRNVNPEETP